MRQMLSTRLPGVLVALLTPGVALLLAGCGSDGADKTGQDGSSAPRTSATAGTQSPEPDVTPDESPSASPRPTGDTLPADPATDASAQVDEAFRAAGVVALQGNLRYIDGALGAPKDIDKADAQCADLQRNVANPDQVAARRFSTGNHKVTTADGKRINTLLSDTYCG
ncbi:hypothetical protein ACIBCS_04075 [Streptomyces phaeochromogenes]|uniref:hypothetical protein n=1 Tax=Streptomyces phaeochromogenes TaxID=1923 RepID=UPI0033CC012A